MSARPYIIIKCAMSLDGYLDDISNDRLILSTTNDFDRVDEERAKCDAILVGAETIRKDNPRLMLRSDERMKNRVESGVLESPIKVTMTRSGNLSPDSKFFTHGNIPKLIYCKDSAYDRLSSNIGAMAEIIPINTTKHACHFMVEDLFIKGVRRLMIEGGGNILTEFLSLGLFDELQVSVAPFFVGEQNAARFVNAASFINNKNNRLVLESVEVIDDMALLTYKGGQK